MVYLGSLCSFSVAPCNLKAKRLVSWVEYAADWNSTSLRQEPLSTSRLPSWSREPDGQCGQDKLGESGVLRTPQ